MSAQSCVEGYKEYREGHQQLEVLATVNIDTDRIQWTCLRSLFENLVKFRTIICLHCIAHNMLGRIVLTFY